MSTALSLIKAIEKHPELKSAETERDALKMLKRLKVMKEAPERKEKILGTATLAERNMGSLIQCHLHIILCVRIALLSLKLGRLRNSTMNPDFFTKWTTNDCVEQLCYFLRVSSF